MNTFNLEALKIITMASGHLSLELSEKIDWEDFSRFASTFLEKVNGRALEKVETFDMHIWDVVINGVTLQLVWDDYPVMTSLEANCDAGDSLLKTIFESLKGLNNGLGTDPKKSVTVISP